MPVAIAERERATVDGAAADAGRGVLVCLSLSTLMPALNASVANVGLPALAEAFGASFQSVQWVVLAYLLAISSLIVGAGRLSDRIGHRRVLLAGIWLFTAASLLCGVAPTLSLLIAARALQGVGAAVMMALTVALVGETVPKARMGSVMGLLGSMSAIGTTLGPSIGGVLIAGLGWRAIFLASVPIGMLNLYWTYRSLPASRREPQAGPAGVDVPGTLLLGLSLAAYALALTTGHGRFGARNLALLSAAVLGVGLFALVEARTETPLIDLRIFRSAALRANLAMSAMVATVVMATLVVGPFYLSRTLGLEAAAVGAAMSAGPLMAALAGIPAGRMVDRFGAARIAVAGLMVMTAGCLALCLQPVSAGLAGYIGSVVVVTSGYALFQAANNTATMTGVAADRRGVISGMLNLSRNLGLVTGASAMAAVFALASAAPDVATAGPEAVAAGMRATFLAAAAMVGAALMVATVRRTGRTLRPTIEEKVPGR